MVEEKGSITGISRRRNWLGNVMRGDSLSQNYNRRKNGRENGFIGLMDLPRKAQNQGEEYYMSLIRTL